MLPTGHKSPPLPARPATAVRLRSPRVEHAAPLPDARAYPTATFVAALPAHAIVPQAVPIEQSGSTCKLVALRVAAQQCAARTGRLAPPPVLQRDQAARDPRGSLRAQAKQRYGSRVGEMFRAEDLVELAKDNGFDRSRVIECDAASYLPTLKALINANVAPVVFYAVDTSTEQPIMHNGWNEHAATVTAYSQTREGFTDFMMVHWGDFIPAAAEALAESTASLPRERSGEVYMKKALTPGTTPRWYDLSFMGAVSPQDAEIDGHPLRSSDGVPESLRFKVVVVDATPARPVEASARRAVT